MWSMEMNVRLQLRSDLRKIEQIYVVLILDTIISTRKT